MIRLAAVVAVLVGLGSILMAADPAVPGAPGNPVAPEVPALLANGDFEKATNGWPDGWPRGEGITWEQEEANHFLRLRVTEAGKTLTLYRAVPVKAVMEALELSYRVRYTDVKPGKEVWHDARIILHFRDAAGQELKPALSHPNFKGSSNGWVSRTQRLTVPAGAATLEIMPALFQVENGTLDLDDLRLVVVPGGAAPTAAPAAPVPATATPSPAAPAAPRPAVAAPRVPTTMPAALRVVGPRLETVEGKPVWLQGVNVPSLEWSVAGEHVLQSVAVAIDDWKANAIRLPVSAEHWFGQGKGQTDGGAGYRDLVDQTVLAVAGRGAYVVLDLHAYRAPRPESAAFWKDAAAHFKDHPAVLFDLLNEPHDITWDVWRNGGPVQEKPKGATEPVTFQSMGMQGLVDVVRATGARNVLVAGGLDWAYDLSGIVRGYALEDKTGAGIVYASHIYSWKRDWQNKVLVAAAKYPVLVGEAGGEPKPLPFVAADRHEDPYTWAPDMLGLIQQHQLHWTAWSFHPSASPRLLTDWNYTPTPYWGAFVRAALKGAKFEVRAMR